MAGKTVVITGATSGIGEVAADRLATKGERIVFIARDRARAEETLKHLHAIADGLSSDGSETRALRELLAGYGLSLSTARRCGWTAAKLGQPADIQVVRKFAGRGAEHP